MTDDMPLNEGTGAAEATGGEMPGGDRQPRQDTFYVRGEELLAKVKELIHEGNVRRIIIRDKEGKDLVQFPLTVGVVGAVFAPVLIAVGALAAILTECSIIAERAE